MRIVTEDRSCWQRSATCSCAGDTCWPSYRSPTSTWRGRGLGGEIAMARYHSCMRPSTIWSVRDNCWHMALERRVYWWRHCLSRADGDVAEAEAAVERLAAAPADED